MVPMEYKGAFMWLLPTATRLGYWSLNNPVTQAAWIYAFYALVPMCLFLLGCALGGEIAEVSQGLSGRGKGISKTSKKVVLSMCLYVCFDPFVSFFFYRNAAGRMSVFSKFFFYVGHSVHFSISVLLLGMKKYILTYYDGFGLRFLPPPSILEYWCFSI